MNVTAVLAEIVIIGSTFNIGIFLIIVGIDKSILQTISILKDIDAVILVFFIGFSYFIGNLVNVFSHIIFDKLDKKIRKKILKNKCDSYHITRLNAYKTSGNLKSFLDVRYSIIRLFRSSIFSLPVLGIGLIFLHPDFLNEIQFVITVSIPFLLTLFSFLALMNQTKKFYTTIDSLECITNIETLSK